MEKDTLTTHDIARHCRVNTTTVINWTKDGSLKAYRTKGGHRRVKKDDLVNFLKEHNMPITIKEKILIADDDEAIRAGLKRVFEAKGYEVDVASNGFEAGALIAVKNPALVILDLIMHHLDGFQVCEYVRKHDHLKHTKIIILTGYPSKENIKKAKCAGANRILGKPVGNKTILKEVRQLLGVMHAEK